MTLLDLIWAYLERVTDRHPRRSLDLIAEMQSLEAGLIPSDPLRPHLGEAIINLHRIAADDHITSDRYAA